MMMVKTQDSKLKDIQKQNTFVCFVEIKGRKKNYRKFSSSDGRKKGLWGECCERN